MPCHRYYEIPRSAFLFYPASGEDESVPPEEFVRQWCAFELIRYYGCRVVEIEFERRVKVGSKTYEIDILVTRDGRPWLVVECKAQTVTKAKEAIEQAISYADAQPIQAEFVLFTNGSDWQVRRKIQGSWVAVAELPNQRLEASPKVLGEILYGFEELMPLIYKLDEPVSGKEAHAYLCAMQEFFSGQNLFLRDANDLLCSGADNLLRALAVEKDDPHYEWGKLGVSQRNWENYRKHDLGNAGHEIIEVGGGLWASELCRLRGDLELMVSHAPQPHCCDVLILRLSIALLDYGDAVARKRQRFRPIGPNIHHALRNLINYGLTVHFDTQLPDPIAVHEMADVKGCCAGAWEQLVESQNGNDVFR